MRQEEIGHGSGSSPRDGGSSSSNRKRSREVLEKSSSSSSSSSDSDDDGAKQVPSRKPQCDSGKELMLLKLRASSNQIPVKKSISSGVSTVTSSSSATKKVVNLFSTISSSSDSPSPELLPGKPTTRVADSPDASSVMEQDLVESDGEKEEDESESAEESSDESESEESKNEEQDDDDRDSDDASSDSDSSTSPVDDDAQYYQAEIISSPAEDNVNIAVAVAAKQEGELIGHFLSS